MTTPSQQGSSSVLAQDLIAEALLKLARGTPGHLSSFLHCVEGHAEVDGTKIISHTHCLTLDGNGRPRIRDFIEQLVTHVLDYAIPRSDIANAEKQRAETGSTAGYLRLHNEARKLFTHLANTGEGGELLLFALAETLLQLPQVLCKMNLKTNTHLHFHGADGVHAEVTPSGHLALYWGESKIYSDFADATRVCLSDLAQFFHNPTGTGARDLQLIARYIDLNDPALESAIKRFLDPADSQSLQLEFRGLCLVGFDHACYPTAPNVGALEDVVSAVQYGMPKWKDHVRNRALAEHLGSFFIHMFCVPFPSVDEFRARFLTELGLTS